MRDQDRIKSLVEDLGRKDRDFREKFVEVVGWRRKCEELEGEISGLKENAEKVSDKMPKRRKGNRLVTPEQKRSWELVVPDSENEGEGDDGVLLKKLQKKRVREVGDETDKGDESEGSSEGDTEVDEVQTLSMPINIMEEVRRFWIWLTFLY
ncbi:uncharacterized protein A4U43_C02F18190 [Asparagus officinalis]|uniref:Uncharacterized protein n=1 Tax=Asparagus officinalis TaxID=4686 RepID=A0A5P1FNV9_ASPOF|nr:uncharacterized protein LOC109825049 [Asparagus officinalis]XP_020252263.1 uncharacterized protein LOC109829616 [Asparagus officinalis]ONK78381.1 uncharacterized protein A4U43_C02F18190 [Asparagus officinalis]